jgi:hypothetical protein
MNKMDRFFLHILLLSAVAVLAVFFIFQSFVSCLNSAIPEEDYFKKEIFLEPEVKVYDPPDNVLFVSDQFLLPVSPPYREHNIVYAGLIEDLIWCESRGDKWAVGDAGEKGILQFMPSTFQCFCVKKYGLPDDIWNTNIQKECCDLMIGDGYLNHWTCASKI